MDQLTEFQHNYLEEWLRTGHETIENSRVSSYLDSLTISKSPKITDDLLRALDISMQNYAKSWDVVSSKHREKGLYSRIKEFMRPLEGILVDIGCGGGNFIAELDRQKVIGLDINGYALQLAQQRLTSEGVQTSLHDKSYISFDPQRGFILKPHPILEELNLDGINLICDDVTSFDNTMRVLYNQGVKVNGAVFLLSGGVNIHRSVGFLDFLRTGKAPGSEAGMFEALTSVINNIPKICYKDSFVYFGIRGAEGDVGFNWKDIGSFLTEKFTDKIEVERSEVIPMLDERQSGGISLKVVASDPRIKLTPEQMERAQAKEYHLLLAEARVKSD